MEKEDNVACSRAWALMNGVGQKSIHNICSLYVYVYFTLYLIRTKAKTVYKETITAIPSIMSVLSISHIGKLVHCRLPDYNINSNILEYSLRCFYWPAADRC